MPFDPARKENHAALVVIQVRRRAEDPDAHCKIDVVVNGRTIPCGESFRVGGAFRITRLIIEILQSVRVPVRHEMPPRLTQRFADFMRRSGV